MEATKKSSFPAFTEPTRQSIFAIAMIIQKFVKILFRQLWPILLILIIGGRSGRHRWTLFAVMIFASISMVLAIIAYYRFYFFIRNDELNIRKGVLNRTSLNIPFDRIQSINFQQTPLHRLFNVVKVEIDTAGSAKSEIALDALSREDAHQLREIILERKKELVPDLATESEVMNVKASPKEEKIFSLSLKDLLKVSITQNHIRSGGLIFAFGWWILSQLEDVGMDVEEVLKELFQRATVPKFYTVLFVLAALIIASLIISVARTVIKYYDLCLWRSGDKYRLVSGLFTRKETAAIDQKIQLMEWSNNPLKRLYNHFDMRLKQASSATVRSRKAIAIPGCSPKHIKLLQENWLGKSFAENPATRAVSIHYFYRRLMYRVLFVAGLFAALFLSGNEYYWLSLLLLPYFILTSWLAYKKRGYAIAEDLLLVRRGIFGNWFSVMPLYKIQSVILSQRPYESRRNLATIDISTASGKMTIPFVEQSTAELLRDYFLYKVESDERDWM